MTVKKWIAVIILLVIITASIIMFGLTGKVADKNYQAGLNYYDSTLYQQALPCFAKALKWDSKNDTIRYDLARTYFHLEKYRKSDSLCTDILSRNADFPVVYITKGQICIKRAQFDNAIEILNKAIDQDSLIAQAWHFRGLAYANLGEFNLAIADYEKAQSLSENDIQSYLSSVAVRTSMDDYSGVIADYDRILELDSRHAEAWYMRGYFKYKINDLKSALGDFDQAIELNDTIAKAYYYRGLSHGKLNHMDSALSDFKTSLHMNYKKDASLYNLAKVNFGKKEYTETERELTTLLENFPRTVYRQDAFKLLASIGMTTNNAEKALNYLNNAITEFPEQSEFYFYRAVNFERLKKYQEAINDLNKCISFGMVTHEVYTSLGIQYLSLSNFPEGCKYLHIALEKGSPVAENLIKQYCKNR